MVKKIFLLGLFLMPFIYWPKNILPFEIPRVWFFNRYVEILFVSSLLFNYRSLLKKEINFSLFLIPLFFLITVFLSSVIGTDFIKSYFGNYYRADGIQTLIHLIAFSFFLMLFFEKDWWGSLIKTLALSGFFISFWQFIAAIRNWGVATSISFGHPNFLAGFLLCTLPFPYYLLQKPLLLKEKIFWSAAFFCQVLALLLTQSRAAYLGLIIFLIFIIFQKIQWPKILYILVIIIALGGSYWFDFKTQSKGIEERRERIVTKGLMAFTTKPIFGFGWTNFDYAFESVNWPLKVKLNKDVAIDKAHSNLLEVLVTTGMVGFVLYFLLILKVLKNLQNPLLFLAFLLFLYHSQTTVISISEEIFFWLTLGLSSLKT